MASEAFRRENLRQAHVRRLFFVSYIVGRMYTLPPLSEADRRQLEIYRSMTPFQRWEQACKLREMAWEIRSVALRKKITGERVKEFTSLPLRRRAWIQPGYN